MHNSIVPYINSFSCMYPMPCIDLTVAINVNQTATSFYIIKEIQHLCNSNLLAKLDAD